MKCEKCGNEYPTPYYFQTPTVCKECFGKMSPEEQQTLSMDNISYSQSNPLTSRIGFLKRFGAFLIDFVILFGISWVVQYFTGYHAASKEFQLAIKDAGQDAALMMQLTTEFLSSQRNNLLLSTIIPLIYLSMEILYGAALGKILLKLKIADADMTNALSSSLITRYLIKYIASLVSIIIIFSKSPMGFFLMIIIAFISMLSYLFVFGQKKQALHDMIAGTAVYNKNDIKMN